jgi:hypothetical protein
MRQATARRRRRPDHPADWYRTRVGSWLAQADRSPDELLDLLEGAGLPPVGQDEEPYVWLLRALPEEEPERNAAAARLAATAATLLQRRPDVELPARMPESVLYNLLLVCAGLHRPQELAEPLFAVWKRMALAGRWLGLDLRAALSAALASNQIDHRLWPEWQELLRGKPGTFLRGHPNDGFDGALWMPTSAGQLGKPNLPVIGKALKLMAGHLEDDRQRRQEFQRLIRRVLETYPEYPSWDEELIRLADRENFPVWAVECLPCLSVDLGRVESGLQIYLLWNPLVLFLGGIACLDEGGVLQESGLLCSGVIAEVGLGETLRQRLLEISPDFERQRLMLPSPGLRQMQGAVVDAMAAVEQRYRRQGRPTEAASALEARRVILRRPPLALVAAAQLQVSTQAASSLQWQRE